MENDNLLKDDYGGFEENTYFNFHLKNKGRVFSTPEGIKTKLQVWIEHKDFPETLRNISLGKNPNYVHVDKKGWRNGVMQFKQSKNELY